MSIEKVEFDRETIEKRRLALLDTLLRNHHPLDIFANLDTLEGAAFMVSDAAADAIRNGLTDSRRQHNESTALARLKIAARTPDKKHFVYVLDSFKFETLGTADAVYTVERERLGVGEVEVHSHVFSRPDYLGKTDIGDLIAAIEGPAWISPPPQDANTAVRVFAVLSVHANKLASLQFYIHDLREDLSRDNAYGLKQFGLAVRFPHAF